MTGSAWSDPMLATAHLFAAVVGYQPGGRASAHRRVQAVWQAIA